jgi:DNA polymerase IV
MQIRKIIHVDMDAFYASVEQLDNPDLREKPVAVGWSGERGVLTTASYEARKFGVRSAMSSIVAARKCPGLIFVPPRFDRYKEISIQVQQIFSRYTDIIEPLSLDEAFLDVTYNKVNIPSATIIAQAIKNDILNEIQLVASAGVSYNKFLAKIASDQDKPNGLFVIRPQDAEVFLNKLAITKFFGVGKVTAEKFINMGILNGKDLKTLSLEFLTNQFGKSGVYFYNVCRGIDLREVEPYRERKSVACENTFEKDIFDYHLFCQETHDIVEGAWKRYSRIGKIAKTVQLKVKFNDFKTITRSTTNQNGFYHKEQIENEIVALIANIFPLAKPVRLIGVQLTNFIDEDEPIAQQLTLNF